MPCDLQIFCSTICAKYCHCHLYHGDSTDLLVSSFPFSSSFLLSTSTSVCLSLWFFHSTGEGSWVNQQLYYNVLSLANNSCRHYGEPYWWVFIYYRVCMCSGPHIQHRKTHCLGPYYVLFCMCKGFVLYSTCCQVYMGVSCQRSRRTHSYALASSPGSFMGGLVHTVCTCIYNNRGMSLPFGYFRCTSIYPMSLAML